MYRDKGIMWKVTSTICGGRGDCMLPILRRSFETCLVTSLKLMLQCIVFCTSILNRLLNLKEKKCSSPYSVTSGWSVPAKGVRMEDEPDCYYVEVNDTVVEVNEENAWLCIFTEAMMYNHIVVDYEDRLCVIFDAPPLFKAFLLRDWPVQRRRYPTQWDIEVFDAYVEEQADDLDDELRQLE
jgi:hypothetical protein